MPIVLHRSSLGRALPLDASSLPSQLNNRGEQPRGVSGCPVETVAGATQSGDASSAASARLSTDVAKCWMPVVDLAVLAGGVAGVDALEDDRQLPVAEGDEEVELGEVAAGALGVAGRSSSRSGKPGARVAGWPSGDRLLAGLGPVDHQQADVGERVAEGAELPVDDRGHLALGGEDHVVEAVVAVDDRRRALLGDRAPRAARGPRRSAGSSRVFDFSHWPCQRCSWRAT